MNRRAPDRAFACPSDAPLRGRMGRAHPPLNRPSRRPCRPGRRPTRKADAARPNPNPSHSSRTAQQQTAVGGCSHRVRGKRKKESAVVEVKHGLLSPRRPPPQCPAGWHKPFRPSRSAFLYEPSRLTVRRSVLRHSQQIRDDAPASRQGRGKAHSRLCIRARSSFAPSSVRHIVHARPLQQGPARLRRLDRTAHQLRQLCIGVSVVLYRALQQQARAAYVPLFQQPCGQFGQARIQEPIDLAAHIFDFKFLRKIGQRFFVRLCDCVQQFFFGRLFGRPQRFVYAAPSPPVNLGEASFGSAHSLDNKREFLWRAAARAFQRSPRFTASRSIRRRSD